MKQGMLRENSGLVGSRGDGGSCAEVAPGVYRRIVNSNFVMKMRPGRAPAGAFVADNISTLHMHSDLRVECGQMAVPGGNAEAVIDYNQAPVSRAPVHYADDSFGRSADLVPIMRGNIHPGMKRAFTAERVKPLAKVSGNFTLYRPKRGNNSEAAQVGRRQ